MIKRTTVSLRWQGHPGFTDTWRSVEYLADIKELVDAYDARIDAQLLVIARGGVVITSNY